MPLVTPKLEFSTNDLSVSNAAATWTNITQYCKSAAWSSGVNREFDDPQAGTAVFVLKNLQRRFEPEYTAGAYYPNIVPGRRFRLTITADGVNYQQGIWYAQSWEVSYPDRSQPYSEVVVTCSDGFWRLALNRLALFNPPNAESYADVVLNDNPVAYYRLAENGGRKINPEVGPDGVYRGQVDLNQTNPVLGDAAGAASFNSASIPMSSGGPARAKIDDPGIFNDQNAFSVEAVYTNNTGSGIGNTQIAAGPQNATGVTFALQGGQAQMIVGTSTIITTTPAAGAGTIGTHHAAATWDGGVLSFYLDGVLIGTVASGSSLANPNAGEFLYIAGTWSGFSPGQGILSHVAFYNYPLTAAQVSNHANAATSHGYAAATIGTRIAAVATDSLWSTAGITAGSITAAARFKNGQVALDEIVEASRIGQPGTLFYFNDNGDPANRTLADTQTSSATFGDAAGEVPYDGLNGLVMNDEVFNSSTVSGDGLAGSTAQNTTSQSDMGIRAQDVSGIYANQTDTALVAQAIVDQFSTPAYRLDSIELNGGSGQQARTQILTREVGDTIRIRRRGEGGTPIDIITRILQKQKSIDVHGDLRCTWTLARGFNASIAQWRLAVTGFGELGQTTTLA